MKTIHLLLLSLFAFTLFNCKQSSDVELSVSPSSFNISSSDTNIIIEISSSSTWKITSDSKWCTPDKTTGANHETVSITLSPNITTTSRTATLTVTDQHTSLKVQVKQTGNNGEEYHYQLPVVFHILYNDKNDKNQYVDNGWLPQVINICNKMYANKFDNGDKDRNSVNINLEFVLATTDPKGNHMFEPGVNRVYWSTPQMDCEKFMDENSTANAGLLWDLNNYINIFIYTFTNENILGISHIPYASSINPLIGLYNGDYYFNNAKTKYPHSISINNTYIYNIPEFGYYSSSNVSTTLAHELGHYLGLFHAFGVSQEKNGVPISWQEDSDYCEDTPNYDRKTYEDWVQEYMSNTPDEGIKFSTLIQRTSDTEMTFDARNIMDYFYCLSNEFTRYQRKRIRHVLGYSPLMPGPKYQQPDTRSAENAEIPPIRSIK